ncbi:hypothetical protein QJS10_CPA09g01285 [Acorus calamus]|uniref:RNase H type-1 domain-containing protein n=1 Tax=Acorus calamus TaxID=4465 RepID=A0AAV9E8D9_ACOCL|nr:hypothetical protein QJS10_CPA09g01285 [Acorus calamus]
MRGWGGGGCMGRGRSKSTNDTCTCGGGRRRIPNACGDRAGFGAIVMNWKGEPLHAVAVQEQDLGSINVIKFKAMLAGLRMCFWMGLIHIHLESDSTTAITWLKGKGCLPWQLIRERNEMDVLLASHTACQVSHTFREGNQPTNLLASWQNTPGLTLMRPDQFDEALQLILDKDAAGAISTISISK